MTRSSTPLPWSARVRRGLARAIRASGLGGLAERANSSALPILTYHRVLPGEAAAAYPFEAMVMPLDQFEAQMAHLAARYEPLTMGEALHLLPTGRLPRRAVVVTFDDGYRDNFDHAFPVLERHGIPATFFVVTGVLDGNTRLWWDEVAEAAAAISKHRRGGGANRPRLAEPWASILSARSGAADGGAVARELVARLNAAPRAERLRVLAALREIAGPPPAAADAAPMTWDDARTMSRWGHTIGAHTVTHAFLDEIDDGEAREEIERSVARVREMIGEPPRYFSYPRGRVSVRAKRLLASAGIEAAVTTQAGRNRAGSDRLALRRLDAGHFRLGTGFDPSILEAEIQGWFQALRSGAGSPYRMR